MRCCPARSRLEPSHFSSLVRWPVGETAPTCFERRPYMSTPDVPGNPGLSGVPAWVTRILAGARTNCWSCSLTRWRSDGEERPDGPHHRCAPLARWYLHNEPPRRKWRGHLYEYRRSLAVSRSANRPLVPL